MEHMTEEQFIKMMGGKEQAKRCLERLNRDKKEDLSIKDELFLNSDHMNLFNEYLRRDGTHSEDRERRSLFYILSGNPDLTSKGINRIYDFTDHHLKFPPDEDDMNKYLERFSLCSSSRALLLLACNLYNGSYKSLTFADTFYNLGEDLRALAINSLKIRFERKFIDS